MLQIKAEKMTVLAYLEPQALVKRGYGSVVSAAVRETYGGINCFTLLTEMHVHFMAFGSLS